MNKLFIYSSGLMFALAVMAAHAEGDPAAGKKKSEAVCSACHGVDGNSTMGQFPRIAGQFESYIKQALHEYKNGARKNPIMGPQAATLTDQDIDNVAAWFSQQKGPLHVLKY